MKKRLFVFAVVLSLLVGTLSGCGKSANVKTVDAMINAIGEVTLESEEAIIEAEEAVSALSSSERGELSYYSDLRRMRTELNQLKADEVDDLIKAIGSTVTLESEAAVKAAREAYDALTKDMKSLVSKLSDLEAAEKTIKRLKEEGGDTSGEDESSSEPVDESSSEPEESSSKPEEESSSKPEESSSKPEEESSSKPEESSSKPEEESSSKPEEESSSKPEEESSQSGSSSQELIDACNKAIAAIEFDRESLYNLAQVNAAIDAFNLLTDAEKDELDDEYSFWLCLYELDLYYGTMDDGYLARAKYKHDRATEAEAANTIWLYNLTYHIDDDEGITIYMNYENLSGKTISRITFVVFIMDADDYPILSTNSQGSGPFVSWFLHDYDLASDFYDPGEEGWGPMYAASGQNPTDGFSLFAIEIDYEDGSFVRITNETLLAIYGSDGP